MENESFFKRIHRNGFRWNDFFLIPVLISVILVLVGQLVGIIPMVFAFPNAETDPFTGILSMYLMCIGVWIVVVLYMVITKKNRPMLKCIGTAPKGNRISMLGLGLLIGFLMNGACVLAAWLNHDIALYFDSFDLLPLLSLLLAVFVQSSSEELVDRCFLYQRLRRGYKSPWVAIILSSIVFAALHLGNPGVTWIAMIDLLLSGLHYALAVYYFDSLWLPFGMHTAWNFTQNIIFGLPNSGIVSDYSIFKLDAAVATNSFVYDIGFGVEGTVFSVIINALVCAAIWYLGKKRNKPDYDPWVQQVS